MSHQKIWNYWAKHYEHLWVQKYSLKPTRIAVLRYIDSILENPIFHSIMDIGCGVGELILDLEYLDVEKKVEFFGLDYSDEMIRMAEKKNPKATFYCDDVYNLNNYNQKYSVITCTHSFPYYKRPEKALEMFRDNLDDQGHLIIGFASQNTWYDGLCLFFVKFTTGKAHYPSVSRFKKMAGPYFKVEDITLIKERVFMPSIVVFKLKRR